MKVSGTSRLSADRDAVWQALNDPAVLVRTIPGVQRLEALGDDAYTMTLAAGVGSIKGVYDGKVRLTDRAQPATFRMLAEGAGAPGTIGASVLVTLSEGPDGSTDLAYDAEAVVGGMIGGVGQRMLTGVSKKMAAEFFRNVDVLLSGPGEAAGDTGAAGLPAPSAAPTAAPGQVFTAPASVSTGGGGQGFLVGVAVGAVAALAGAIVGGWLAGRRRG